MPKQSPVKLINKIDWPLLREQKAKLLDLIGNAEADDLNGIVHLIDSIQDYAVDELGFDESVVFAQDEED